MGSVVGECQGERSDHGHIWQGQVNSNLSGDRRRLLCAAHRRDRPREHPRCERRDPCLLQEPEWTTAHRGHITRYVQTEQRDSYQLESEWPEPGRRYCLFSREQQPGQQRSFPSGGAEQPSGRYLSGQCDRILAAEFRIPQMLRRH